MANTLGTLSIDVLANIAGMVSDMGKAQAQAAATSRAIQADFQSMTDGVISGLASIAGALGLAFSADKLVELGKASIDLGNQLDKMSQKVGISVTNLSALRSQAELSDVGFDDFGNAVEKLAKSATAAAEGSAKQAGAYTAMGVSVVNATGQMRPMQDILQDVATKFSTYSDSASKTALAQNLFGKSGAELIPLLNDLGTNGFAKVAEEAAAYNQVIGPEQAAQSTVFHDNLTKLSQATSGFANAIMGQMLPGLVAYSTDMANAAKTTDGYAGSAAVVASAGKGVVLAFEATRQTVIGLTNVVLALGDTLGAAGDLFNGFAKGVGYDLASISAAMTGNMTAAKQYFSQAGTSIADGWTTATNRVKVAWAAASGNVLDAVKDTGKAYDDLFGSFSNVTAGAATTAGAIAKGNAPLVANAQAAKEAQRAMDAYNQSLLKLASLEDQLNSGLGGPYLAALTTYDKGVTALADTWAKAVVAGTANDALIARLSNDGQMLEEQLARTNDQIKSQHDLMDQANEDLTNLSLVYAQLPQHQAAVTAGLQEYDTLMKSHYDFYGNYIKDETDLKAALAAQLPGIIEAKQRVNDLTQAQKLNEQAAQDWQNIWAQAGDGIASTFSKILVEGGSLFDSLKSLAQQTVEAIIQYFAKLEVINPILNAIFGGQSGSLLPTMENSAIGSAESSGVSSIFAGLGASAGTSAIGGDIAGDSAGIAGIDFASTAAGSTEFSIMSPSTWISAGKNMWSGFFNGASAPNSGLFGAWTGSMPAGYADNLGLVPDYAGASPGGSFAPSGLGMGLSVAGGIYAGYNEYNNAGGGFAGAAGGAAYGFGTTAVGLGVASLATGGSFAAGVAAMGALGPIGWAGIALMAVDMLSGGKLFGTSGKVVGGSSTTTVSSTGIDLSSEYTTKGQHALFGGSYWTQHDMAVDPAAQAAADQFFAQLKTGTAAFAKEFGTTMGDIVGGTFQQTFDKNGKVTGSTTTIAGHTYSGETQQQFTEREIAENEIAVLSKFDSNLSASIDQYRTDADTLGAVVNALAQGEAEMQAGTKFLALGSDQSLSALLKLAQGSEQFGETIDQTLQRIEQAQASYDQFVGQFKPAATYVDDFEASLAGIQSQMMANIKQANALAVAAGAAGASETDLANIHQYAAAQAAAAIATLEASAQSLAFNLGITNTGSLDQVNAEIQQLESEAGTGASAVQSFGNAMATAAQKATDAINLLLGTDSPLNDQQKLQEALAGLKAGTVSQTAVLDIGRRLYASSQAYTDLFNEVQQFPGLQSGGSAASGGGSAAGGHGLSSADQQRLQELLKEQATLQAGQTLAQYQTLAQQIAEIASAKGETFQQVIDEMGIKDADLEKGLGIKSDADLNAYLSKIQDQTDSNGDNTMSIVAVLNKIYDVLSGTPDNPTRNGGTLNVPTGHDTHAAPPGMTPSDIRLIGQAFAQAIAPVLVGPRNLRPIRA